MLTKHGVAPLGPLLLGWSIRERQLGRFLAGTALTVTDVTTEETDLEDIFLQLTRGAHAEAAEPAKNGRVA